MSQQNPTKTENSSASTQVEADVLFYVLNSHEPVEREQFLSKLLNTIWKQKRRADVRFANETEAQRFDLMLWNYKPESFIHHAFNQQTAAPIQLYGEKVKQPCQDVLINMHPEFPENHSSYQRTIEILDQSEFLIHMGRERWKTYKNSGIEPTVHKIGFDQ